MENFKLLLDYFDEDGNRSKKETTITVNTVKDVTEKPWFGQHPLKTYDVTFSIKIPEHIHKHLKGKSVPNYGMSTNNGETVYDEKNFKKTITGATLQNVCERYNKVLNSFNWLKETERAELKRVIFYQFNNNSSNYNSIWNGMNYGLKSSLNYKFALGYVSVNARGTEQRYNNEKRMISSSREEDFYQMKFVEYSEEREGFFHGIQRSFETIISNINGFEENLTEESINSLIGNGQFLLGN